MPINNILILRVTNKTIIMYSRNTQYVLDVMTIIYYLYAFIYHTHTMIFNLCIIIYILSLC